MDVPQAVHLTLLTFQTAALVAGPLLGIALVVGFVVGIFQSTTMINEPTLSFAPKLFFLMLALVAFGPWMLTNLVAYTHNLWQLLPAVAP
jgi:flagellar biosynthetic protein FliQ